MNTNGIRRGVVTCLGVASVALLSIIAYRLISESTTSTDGEGPSTGLELHHDQVVGKVRDLLRSDRWSENGDLDAMATSAGVSKDVLIGAIQQLLTELDSDRLNRIVELLRQNSRKPSPAQFGNLKLVEETIRRVN